MQLYTSLWDWTSSKAATSTHILSNRPSSGHIGADQLATVSKARLFRRAGVLSPEDMHKVEEVVKIQLAIL